MNYLGLPGTAAAPNCDYFIADPIVIPPDSRQWFAEKIVYLPDCYQPNDSKREIAAQSISRREAGLPDEAFVFCCFNNNLKLNPDTFDAWSRILSATPGSVLWLVQDSAAAIGNLKREAEARGVDPSRLFSPRRSGIAEHLARHRLADLFLDSWPYGAHTTASDALWAGLPVLTRVGETFASRVASSLLTAVGLPELIAPSREAYIATAIDLAANPDRLKALKEKLERNRATAPLFDTELYTRRLEAAFEAMHARRLANLPPDHIHDSRLTAALTLASPASSAIAPPAPVCRRLRSRPSRRRRVSHSRSERCATSASAKTPRTRAPALTGAEKAHAVEAVVEAHRQPATAGSASVGHRRQHRQRQEAVRDRAAERRGLRCDRIDWMNCRSSVTAAKASMRAWSTDEPARDERSRRRPARRDRRSAIGAGRARPRVMRASPNSGGGAMTLIAAVDRHDRPAGVGAAAAGRDRAASPAMSSGRPSRPIGTALAPRAAPASSPRAKRVMLVGNGPGAIALTVTCRPANSAARMRVR